MVLGVESTTHSPGGGVNNSWSWGWSQQLIVLGVESTIHGSGEGGGVNNS